MKKRIFTLALAFIFALALIPTVTAYANEVSVNINGQPVVFADQLPVIVDGRTLVPVAGVFQVLGFDVAWNGDTQQATLTRATTVVVITIGSSTFTVNGAGHSLDVPAQIIGGRTMLPIAAVLRSVGYDVGWDGANSTVAISEAVTAPVAVVPTPSPQPTPIPAPSPGFDSYQQILDDYSARIREAAPRLAEEFRASASGITDIMRLAELSTEYVARLAEISVAGTTRMAELHVIRGIGSMDVYTAYATLLANVYMEYATLITNVYMELAMGGSLGQLQIPTQPPQPAPTPTPVSAPQPPTSQSLEGTWLFMNIPYYVFESGGRGTMSGMDIHWTTRSGILSICNTPAICGNNCLAPAEWNYVLDGNQLTLTSTSMPSMTFTYTRR